MEFNENPKHLFVRKKGEDQLYAIKFEQCPDFRKANPDLELDLYIVSNRFNEQHVQDVSVVKEIVRNLEQA